MTKDRKIDFIGKVGEHGLDGRNGFIRIFFSKLKRTNWSDSITDDTD